MLDKTVSKIKRQNLSTILKIQQGILRAVDDFMYKNGVVRMMPLMIAPVTDTLNHDVEETSITYQNQNFDVMKSMIFHKQLTLMNEGLEKIYIVSPNIRLERAERGDSRHLFEFTQIDFEFKNANMDDILTFIESLVSYIFSEVKEKYAKEIEEIAGSTEHLNITTPFLRYDTKDLEKLHGPDFEGIASRQATQPFFLTNHKREFYDAEDLNNRGNYRNYDLIWPRGYVEGLSGGEREYLYERIIERMDELNSDKHRFRSYLKLAKDGLIPKTAGAGLGVERMTRFVCQLPEVDAVTVFVRKPGEGPYLF